MYTPYTANPYPVFSVTRDTLLSRLIQDQGRSLVSGHGGAKQRMNQYMGVQQKMINIGLDSAGPMIGRKSQGIQILKYFHQIPCNGGGA